LKFGLSTSSTALLPPVQAEIVPSSVEKIKKAGVPLTIKLAVELATIPVGVAGPVAPDGGGMVTISDCGTP
jgi:hypothetical protein